LVAVICSVHPRSSDANAAGAQAGIFETNSIADSLASPMYPRTIGSQ